MVLTTAKYDFLKEKALSKEQERLNIIESGLTQLQKEYKEALQRGHINKTLVTEVTERIKSAQRYLRNLLKRWQVIKEGAEESRHMQEAHYNEAHKDEGPNMWSEQFFLISDLEGIADDEGKEYCEGLTQCALKEMHPSKSERLMRSFSREITLSRTDPHSPSAVPVEAVVISPDLIPDELAIRLGLIEISEKDRPRDRLRKKEQPECTAKLKEIIERSEEITKDNFRVLILEDGRIFYTAGDVRDDASDSPQKLVVRLYEDAYSALRSTLHQDRLHEIEQARLAQTKAEVAYVNSVLDKGWKLATETEDKESLRALSMALPETHDYLRSCIVRPKVQAEQMLTASAPVVDSLGRNNPGATMMRQQGVIRRLDQRQDDIRGIGSYNSEDQSALRVLIEENEETLKQFRQNLQNNAHLIEKPKLFKKSGDWNPNDSDRILLVNLKLNIEPIKKIKIRPLCFYAQRLIEKYELLRNALIERNRDAAKKEALRMHLIGKFQGTRVLFAKIQEEIIDPEQTTLSAIRSYLNRMRDHLKGRQLFDDYIDDEYDKPFLQLEALVEEIFTCVANALLAREDSAPDADQEEISTDSEVFQTLKTIIENYDLDATMMNLA